MESADATELALAREFEIESLRIDGTSHRARQLNAENAAFGSLHPSAAAGTLKCAGAERSRRSILVRIIGRL